tara:strand:+ start:148 stop:438 length:291 start_codon:yes stop_codon:yes gene_type:complete
MLSACKDFSQVPAARLIHFKYLAPTNHRPSRVKITDKRFNQSVELAYSYDHQSISEQVFDYLTEIGFQVAAINEFSGVVVLARSPNNVRPELRGES